jgi:hypothetical protein
MKAQRKDISKALKKIRELEAMTLNMMVEEPIADVSELQAYCAEKKLYWIHKANVKPTPQNIFRRNLFEQLEITVNNYGPQTKAEFPDTQAKALEK